MTAAAAPDYLPEPPCPPGISDRTYSLALEADWLRSYGKSWDRVAADLAMTLDALRQLRRRAVKAGVRLAYPLQGADDE